MHDFKIVEEVGLSLKMFDEKRLKRQLQGYNSWRKHSASAILIAATGYGKTFYAILAILRMNKFAPDKYTNVIVPNTRLQEDWIGVGGHIQKFKLQRVRVFVINTYTISDLDPHLYQCHLLVIDECHRAAREESLYFSKTLEITECVAKMLLSATLTDEQKIFFQGYGIKVADEVTLEEAEREGYIVNYDLYNLAVNIDDEKRVKLLEYDDIVSKNFSKFDYDYSLLQACTVGNNVPFRHKLYGVKTGSEWKKWYCQKMGGSLDNKDDFWHPSNIGKYANMCNWAIRERKNMLMNLHEKIEITKQLYEKYKIPTIVFSESQNFANLVTEAIGEKCKSYHSSIPSEVYYQGKLIAISEMNDKKTSYKCLLNNKNYTYSELTKQFKGCTRLGKDKVKEKIFYDFEHRKIEVLSAVKALNEGVNIESIEMAIISGGNSKELDNTQRIGRGLRKDANNPNKRALIINLYIPGTQDEKWLNSRQRNTPEYKIRWINNINQIKRESETISLTS